MKRFSILVCIIVAEYVYAFENIYTHPAISQQAANLSQVITYLQSQMGYPDGLNTQIHIASITTPLISDEIENGMDSSITTRSILGWLREGSKLEDAQIWQARSQHHFYDPIRNTGLNNRTDHPYWQGVPTTGSPFDLRGESAFFWTITGTSSTGYPKSNQETWSVVRNKFYNSLTSNTPSNRDQSMAEMFLALGHILHMLEDMGVPAHARNDFLFAHYRSAFDKVWGNPFEYWAEQQVTANNGNILSIWLSGWTSQPKALDKISKYWDTGLYTGTYIGLPSSSWGLAEQTNYQFYSTSTGPNCIGTLYQFPNPSTSHFGADLQESIPTGIKLYFNGSNYGVPHIARKSYTRDYADRHGVVHDSSIDSTITPDDNSVYEDYVRIAVPRTIDYATGLLNYFFRGKLSVDASCYCSECDPIELHITNQSVNTNVNQTLKGGSFELYWDDNAGSRTPVSGFTVYDSNDPARNVLWGSSTTLAKGNAVRATFSKPASSNISKYILVYRGSISENSSNPDPCDANAVAVCMFNPPTKPQVQITQITNEMGCPGTTLNIEGKGFSKTPSHNTVLFDDVTTGRPDVYGTVTQADSNGQWLKVLLPYFDAENVDYYGVNTIITADGNTSAPYNFRLTNYIWCTIFIWDYGTSLDDTFEVWMNGYYWDTYPPSSVPYSWDYGFYYSDGYGYVDTYLVDSSAEGGGTLAILIGPYINWVTAYRWNSSLERQELLYNRNCSGIYNDVFGSNILVNIDDGVELDVYYDSTYNRDMGYSEMSAFEEKRQAANITTKSQAMSENKAANRSHRARIRMRSKNKQ